MLLFSEHFILVQCKHKNPHPVINMLQQVFTNGFPSMASTQLKEEITSVLESPLMTTVLPITSTQRNHYSDFQMTLIGFTSTQYMMFFETKSGVS